MEPVWAVVVTHDRRQSLSRCLEAISMQRRPPDWILVVDNASTDGTRTMLAERYPQVEVLALTVNEGGAGGFHHGMARAHAGGAEWLWLMDDDTVPGSGALEELLKAGAGFAPASRPSVFVSTPLWRDGSVHPLNFPTLERRRPERVMAAAARGLMPMRAATFVSLLIHRGVIDRFGLPPKHYFLWGDDVEYTSRIVLGGEDAYFVPASVVLHDTEFPHSFGAAEPSRFYYHVRNSLLTARGPDRPARDRLIRLWTLVSTSLAYIARSRTAASVAAVLRGIGDGLRMAP
jgi:GT2 family glycosyltransferase